MYFKGGLYLNLYSDYEQLNGLLTESIELKQDVIIPGVFSLL